MSHAQYEERLAIYPDLAPQERAEVDAHLAACAGCAARLAEYQALRRALQARPAPQPSTQLRAGFGAALARARAEDRRGSLWPRLTHATMALGNAAAWAGVAAVALVLVIGLAVAVRPLAQEAWGTGQPTARPAVLPTAPAAPSPDGPAVGVARLQRLQDLCCTPRFAPYGTAYFTVSEQGTLMLHWLDDATTQEVPIAIEGTTGAAFRVGNAAWAPDGTTIVVSQGGVGSPAPVYLVSPASGKARRLGETYSPTRLIFDARGRLVLTTQTAFQTLELGSGATPAEMPGIAPRDAAGVETELAFSPDGRYAAAIEGAQLAIIDLTTGQKTPITTRIHPRWRAAIAWRDGGRQLAYATGERGGAPELWVVGADGAGARRLVTRDDPRDTGGAFAGLAWLPGTPYIVYEFVPWSNIATLQGEYQVVSSEGGAPKTLFTNGLGLNLSPDGRIISFVRDLPGPDEMGNWIAVLEYAGAAMPATPTPAPTAMPNLVDGWTGTVVKFAALAQYDDYFQRSDGERYGIHGATDEIEAQIVAARCQQGTVIRVWGQLTEGIPDAGGRRITVERLEAVSVPPTPVPEEGQGQTPVDGWQGRVIPLCRYDRLDNYFERDDGLGFGIDAEATAVKNEIYIAEGEGYAVRVWGVLYRGVDDYRNARIVVERLEVVNASGTATRTPTPVGGPTPCPSRPIALPAPARFDPLPNARGTIAVSTAGGGFGLMFPDTGAVLPVHTLVPWCGQQVREADRGLAWSPDGRRIAFVYAEYGPPQDQQMGFLMLADLERGELQPLIKNPGVYGRLAWSPDGTRLAFVRYDAQGFLAVLDVASGALRVMASDAIFMPWQAPAWLDDGHLAYSRTASPSGTQAELVRLALDGSAPQVIAQGARVFAFSPDRTQVAYNGAGEAVLLDIASGTSQSYGTLPDGGQLQWSPDGRYLLACPGPGGLFMSRPGPLGPLQQLGAIGLTYGQAWSPDSQRFVFMTGDNDASAGMLPALAIYDMQSRTAQRTPLIVALPGELVWGPR